MLRHPHFRCTIVCLVLYAFLLRRVFAFPKVKIFHWWLQNVKLVPCCLSKGHSCQEYLVGEIARIISSDLITVTSGWHHGLWFLYCRTLDYVNMLNGSNLCPLTQSCWFTTNIEYNNNIHTENIHSVWLRSGWGSVQLSSSWSYSYSQLKFSVWGQQPNCHDLPKGKCIIYLL